MKLRQGPKEPSLKAARSTVHPLPVLRVREQASSAVTDRLLRTGLAVAVIGAAVQGLLHAVNAATLESTALDLNAEGTAFAWASSTAAFAVGFSAVVAALADAAQRNALLALAACAAYISLDDMIALHERISAALLARIGESVIWDSVLWPVLYLPLLGLTFLLLLRLASNSAPRVRRFFHAGLGLLVLAIVAEVLSAPWSDGTNLIHTIEAVFEETAEFAGWTLIATATATVAVRAIAAAERAPQSFVK